MVGMLEELVDLMTQHFVDEEDEMLRLDYPDVDRHRHDHQKFLKELEIMVEDYKANQMFGSQWRIGSWIKANFQTHSPAFDKAYHAFIQEKAEQGDGD